MKHEYQNDAPSKHAEVETQIQGKLSKNKEDAARIADEKWKILMDKIKTREEHMKKNYPNPLRYKLLPYHGMYDLIQRHKRKKWNTNKI